MQIRIGLLLAYDVRMICAVCSASVLFVHCSDSENPLLSVLTRVFFRSLFVYAPVEFGSLTFSNGALHNNLGGLQGQAVQ